MLMFQSQYIVSHPVRRKFVENIICKIRKRLDSVEMEYGSLGTLACTAGVSVGASKKVRQRKEGEGRG